MLFTNRDVLNNPTLPWNVGKFVGSTIQIPDDQTIDWIEEKARGVGQAGNRVADMTSEARRVKKTLSGDK